MMGRDEGMGERKRRGDSLTTGWTRLRWVGVKRYPSKTAVGDVCLVQ